MTPFTEGKTPYLDQFCNVRNVFHAVSLDDNRALDFTPILATGREVRELCPSYRPVVDEVWFSGAHADVGGTYRSRGQMTGHLPGVSLNWMIARLSAFDLLPKGAGQYGNVYDRIHDARAGGLQWRLLSDAKPRPVLDWATRDGGRLRLHFSVEQRFALLGQIDDHFAPCPRQWALMCAGATLRTPYVIGLRAKEDCLKEADWPGGLVFAGKRRPGPGATEVTLNCVTLVYDTPEQRDAIGMTAPNWPVLGAHAAPHAAPGRPTESAKPSSPR